MNNNIYFDNKPPIININYTYNEKEVFELKKEVYSCFNKNIDEWIPCQQFLLINNPKLKNNKLLFTFEFLKIFTSEFNNFSKKK